ncbi:unnamed protein product [Clonostachys solani]|uniref:Uncharacterized protein n=1 Tax=Clonostachys solani TaxID=160281 RepID=A0A9N9ZBR2_9HYPO|nr:unnamed protein product [Clonostachys solani]
MKVLDSFNTTSDRATNASSGAYYSALAIRGTGMEIPFGDGPDCAHQTFNRRDHDDYSRGTIDELLEAIVDSVFMDIKCLKLENWSATRKPTDMPSYYNGKNTIGLFFENCDQSITVIDWGLQLWVILLGI